MGSPRDPRLKLLVTSRLLQLRRDQPRLFLEGEYVPLNVAGPAARHVCAFTWQWQPTDGPLQHVLVIVPRLLAELAHAQAGPLPLWQAETWQDTRVEYAIPADSPLKNRFTGTLAPPGESLAVGPLLAEFPIAVLVG